MVKLDQILCDFQINTEKLTVSTKWYIYVSKYQKVNRDYSWLQTALHLSLTSLVGKHHSKDIIIP